jgi:hypothetical protein
MLAAAALILVSVPGSLAFSNEISDSQPQVKTYDGIPYLSGGFGSDERENLRTMGKDDNLEVTFALQNRDYLGGAEVLIKDANGKEVLKTFSDGPLFFTKLPQGTYTVDATAMGQTEQQIAHVRSDRQAQLHFAWRESREQREMNTLAKK